jgi:hypothetical protein
MGEQESSTKSDKLQILSKSSANPQQILRFSRTIILYSLESIAALALVQLLCQKSCASLDHLEGFSPMVTTDSLHMLSLSRARRLIPQLAASHGRRVLAYLACSMLLFAGGAAVVAGMRTGHADHRMLAHRQEEMMAINSQLMANQLALIEVQMRMVAIDENLQRRMGEITGTMP